MRLLRIRCSLTRRPDQCEWSLVGDSGAPVSSEGPLAELPRGAGRVQMVVPADEVFITRARLPPKARRRGGAILAYSIEDKLADEPDANLVAWLGVDRGEDILAVLDKPGVKGWREALDAAGIRAYEIHSEALLLPWTPGQWTLAWDGSEGFVRYGQFEGAATDAGDRTSPPLSLQLMLEEAEAQGMRPESVTILPASRNSLPDIAVWERMLGTTLKRGPVWDWRMAPHSAGISLVRERQGWGQVAGLARRLRPAGWILAAALAAHATFLVVDWVRLAGEHQALRQQMERRFREAIPDAVAVVDPALQMSRKLAEARHAAGQVDGGDFLPMIGKAAAELKQMPAGSMRSLSFESGRLTVEFSAIDQAMVRQTVARLGQAGFIVEGPTQSVREGSRTAILTARIP